MADPVSLAASIITLLTTAGSSCKFLYNFILDIQDTPDEIKSQNIKLRCLHKTISKLVEAYDGLPQDFQPDSNLRSDIVQFTREIDRIRNNIEKRDGGMRLGRMHLWKEKFRWLSYDRDITKFYNSLDHWVKIFDGASSSVNIKLLAAIHTELLASKSSSTALLQKVLSIPAPFESGGVGFRNQKDGLSLNPYRANVGFAPDTFSSEPDHRRPPKRMTALLKSTIFPVGFIVQYWYTMRGGLATTHIRTGPVLARYWGDIEQDMKLKLLTPSEGYRISSTVQLNFLNLGRLLINLYWVPIPSRSHFFSLRWDMGYYGLLRRDNPAYLACTLGDNVALRKCLAKRTVGISDTTDCGDTLIHVATRYNHIHIVRELIQQGGSVTTANDFGETALHIAVQTKCDYNLTRYLISQGADLCQQDIIGRTPLHGFFNMSFKEIIQHHQDDIDASIEDSRGMTIAHSVAWSKRSEISDLLPCLRGISIEATDSQGRNILHLSLQRGNLELVNYLLNTSNTDILRPDWNGLTLIHHASISRCSHLIDILLQRGYDIHATDHKGRTALHHAAMNDKLESIRKLIDCGASSDLDVIDQYSMTPLQVALNCSARNAVEYIKLMCTTAQLELPEPRKFDQPKTFKWYWISIGLNSGFILASVSVVVAVVAVLGHFWAGRARETS